MALKSRSHGNFSLKFLALNGFILTRAVKQLHRATNDKAIKYVLRIAFEVLITRYRRQVKARVKRLNSFLLTMAKTKVGSIARHKVDKQVTIHSVSIIYHTSKCTLHTSEVVPIQMHPSPTIPTHPLTHHPHTLQHSD